MQQAHRRTMRRLRPIVPVALVLMAALLQILFLEGANAVSVSCPVNGTTTLTVSTVGADFTLSGCAVPTLVVTIQAANSFTLISSIIQGLVFASSASTTYWGSSGFSLNLQSSTISSSANHLIAFQSPLLTASISCSSGAILSVGGTFSAISAIGQAQIVTMNLASCFITSASAPAIYFQGGLFGADNRITLSGMTISSSGSSAFATQTGPFSTVLSISGGGSFSLFGAFLSVPSSIVGLTMIAAASTSTVSLGGGLISCVGTTTSSSISISGASGVTWTGPTAGPLISMGGATTNVAISIGGTLTIAAQQVAQVNATSVAFSTTLIGVSLSTASNTAPALLIGNTGSVGQSVSITSQGCTFNLQQNFIETRGTVDVLRISMTSMSITTALSTTAKFTGDVGNAIISITSSTIKSSTLDAILFMSPATDFVTISVTSSTITATRHFVYAFGGLLSNGNNIIIASSSITSTGGYFGLFPVAQSQQNVQITSSTIVGSAGFISFTASVGLFTATLQSSSVTCGAAGGSCFSMSTIVTSFSAVFQKSTSASVATTILCNSASVGSVMAFNGAAAAVTILATDASSIQSTASTATNALISSTATIQSLQISIVGASSVTSTLSDIVNVFGSSVTITTNGATISTGGVLANGNIWKLLGTSGILLNLVATQSTFSGAGKFLHVDQAGLSGTSVYSQVSSITSISSAAIYFGSLNSGSLVVLGGIVTGVNILSIAGAATFTTQSYLAVSATATGSCVSIGGTLTGPLDGLDATLTCGGTDGNIELSLAAGSTHAVTMSWQNVAITSSSPAVAGIYIVGPVTSLSLGMYLCTNTLTGPFMSLAGDTTSLIVSALSTSITSAAGGFISTTGNIITTFQVSISSCQFTLAQPVASVGGTIFGSSNYIYTTANTISVIAAAVYVLAGAQNLVQTTTSSSISSIGFATLGAATNVSLSLTTTKFALSTGSMLSITAASSLVGLSCVPSSTGITAASFVSVVGSAGLVTLLTTTLVSATPLSLTGTYAIVTDALSTVRGSSFTFTSCNIQTAGGLFSATGNVGTSSIAVTSSTVTGAANTAVNTYATVYAATGTISTLGASFVSTCIKGSTSLIAASTNAGLNGLTANFTSCAISLTASGSTSSIMGVVALASAVVSSVVSVTLTSSTITVTDGGTTFTASSMQWSLLYVTGGNYQNVALRSIGCTFTASYSAVNSNVYVGGMVVSNTATITGSNNALELTNTLFSTASYRRAVILANTGTSIFGFAITVQCLNWAATTTTTFANLAGPASNIRFTIKSVALWKTSSTAFINIGDATSTAVFMEIYDSKIFAQNLIQYLNGNSVTAVTVACAWYGNFPMTAGSFGTDIQGKVVSSSACIPSEHAQCWGTKSGSRSASPSRTFDASNSTSPSLTFEQSKSATMNTSSSDTASSSNSMTYSSSTSMSQSLTYSSTEESTPSETTSTSLSVSASVSLTATPSDEITASLSSNQSHSLSVTMSNEASRSASMTASQSDSKMPSFSPSISESSDVTLSASPSLSKEMSASYRSQSPTFSVSTSQSVSVSPTFSITSSVSLSDSASADPPTASRSSSYSMSSTYSNSVTESQSMTLSRSVGTLSASDSEMLSDTRRSTSMSSSVTPSASVTLSQSPEPSDSVTPSSTPTLTQTPTLTYSESLTQDPATATPTPTMSPSETTSQTPDPPSASLTPSNTPSATSSVTPTPSDSQLGKSQSETGSVSNSNISSRSLTPTNSITDSPDRSTSPSYSQTPTVSVELSNNTHMLSRSSSWTTSVTVSPSSTEEVSRSVSLSQSISASPTDSNLPTTTNTLISERESRSPSLSQEVKSHTQSDTPSYRSITSDPSRSFSGSITISKVSLTEELSFEKSESRSSSMSAEYKSKSVSAPTPTSSATVSESKRSASSARSQTETIVRKSKTAAKTTTLTVNNFTETISNSSSPSPSIDRISVSTLATVTHERRSRTVTVSNEDSLTADSQTYTREMTIEVSKTMTANSPSVTMSMRFSDSREKKPTSTKERPSTTVTGTTTIDDTKTVTRPSQSISRTVGTVSASSTADLTITNTEELTATESVSSSITASVAGTGSTPAHSSSVTATLSPTDLKNRPNNGGGNNNGGGGNNNNPPQVLISVTVTETETITQSDESSRSPTVTLTETPWDIALHLGALRLSDYSLIVASDCFKGTMGILIPVYGVIVVIVLLQKFLITTEVKPDDDALRVRPIRCFAANHMYLGGLIIPCHNRCVVVHGVECATHVTIIACLFALMYYVFNPPDGNMRIVVGAAATIAAGCIRAGTSRIGWNYFGKKAPLIQDESALQQMQDDDGDDDEVDDGSEGRTKKTSRKVPKTSAEKYDVAIVDFGDDFSSADGGNSPKSSKRNKINRNKNIATDDSDSIPSSSAPTRFPSAPKPGRGSQNDRDDPRSLWEDEEDDDHQGGAAGYFDDIDVHSLYDIDQRSKRQEIASLRDQEALDMISLPASLFGSQHQSHRGGGRTSQRGGGASTFGEIEDIDLSVASTTSRRSKTNKQSSNSNTAPSPTGGGAPMRRHSTWMMQPMAAQEEEVPSIDSDNSSIDIDEILSLAQFGGGATNGSGKKLTSTQGSSSPNNSSTNNRKKHVVGWTAGGGKDIDSFGGDGIPDVESIDMDFVETGRRFGADNDEPPLPVMISSASPGETPAGEKLNDYRPFYLVNALFLIAAVIGTFLLVSEMARQLQCSNFSTSLALAVFVFDLTAVQTVYSLLVMWSLWNNRSKHECEHVWQLHPR
ncbi:membrane-associated protein, putative [Bodo saltans]|uniref:Membrane-associated protein, putative n=1 Tax=Bodo saltans TaxID=75058 RepID=A0A0S4JIH1_BODSA|nr:membrane-associated protein, putative [Bodo saltans]|eukprot:CUG89721.1 membrane-associated protein, putative [Bodo saltans]